MTEFRTWFTGCHDDQHYWAIIPNYAAGYVWRPMPGQFCMCGQQQYMGPLVSWCPVQLMAPVEVWDSTGTVGNDYDPS